MRIYSVDSRLSALLHFMSTYSNWMDIIKKAPYFVKVKQKDNLVLLKYDMYNSDFRNPVVQACRGIIIDTNKPVRDCIVCHSFNKFFNQGERYYTYNMDGVLTYGEDLAYKLDYNKPYEIQEKLDGSMLRLWFYNGEWRVSTSGTIDANEAPVSGSTYSFGSLFWETMKMYYPDLSVLNMLNKNLCYTFELVSPISRIVVSYKKNALYLLSAFDVTTLQEISVSDEPSLRQLKFDKPRIYPKEFMSSIDSIDNFEGCVITQIDEFGVLQRVKLKSKKYLELFHIATNSSEKDLFNSIILGTIDDVLSKFPEYSERVSKITDWLKDKCEEINNVLDKADYSLDRKMFAVTNRDNLYLFYLWKKYDNPEYKAEDYILNVDNVNKVWNMYKEDNS